MKRISLLLLVCLLPGVRAYGDITCTGSDDTATLSGAPNTGLVNGLYSLYVKQASSPSTTTIRTSQNTVRVNSTDPTVQLRSAFPSPNAGIVDATNANNVLVSSILGSAGLSLAVDFISFTRYITTISGSSSSQLTLSVPAPSGDTSNPPSYVQMERRAIGDV